MTPIVLTKTGQPLSLHSLGMGALTVEVPIVKGVSSYY